MQFKLGNIQILKMIAFWWSFGLTLMLLSYGILLNR